jgi:hypothetical protein
MSDVVDKNRAISTDWFFIAVIRKETESLSLPCVNSPHTYEISINKYSPYILIHHCAKIF